MPAQKKKIVILGGGLGSMTTAYWLTEKDQWQDHYDITVYQLGWRLGGKGASGRDVRPGYGKRIEEHGLHIWFGFYENAFRVMRQALNQLAEFSPPPVKTFKTWTDAFKKHSLVNFEELIDGEWSHWPILFPPNGDTPGDGDTINSWEVFVTMIGWIKTLYEEFTLKTGRALSEGVMDSIEWLPGWLRELCAVGAETATNIACGTVVELMHAVSGMIPDSTENELQDILAKLVGLLRGAMWELLEEDMDNAEVRHFWILLDLASTMAIGILEDDLLDKGFEAADEYDWAEWLTMHGAKPISVDSALVRTVYDLVFGFEQGDTTRPNFAAGTAVRGIMRMIFTYKGSLMYKMCAGMGDTIFTPFYGLLKKRGVKFKFFHKVEQLHLDSADPTQIGSISIAKQVQLKPEVEANGGYWPLIEVKGLDCWPSQPDYDQIVDGDKLKEDPYNPGHPYNLESYWSSWQNVEQFTLQRGIDFDTIIFGISIGAVPHLCKELIDQSSEWKRMVDGGADSSGVETVQTQGVQLWFTPNAKQLGWEIPDWAIDVEKDAGEPLGLRGLAGGYAQDLNTWCDLSGLLDVEDWPADNMPGNLTYLCGLFKDFDEPHPFSDHSFPRKADEALFKAGKAWLDSAAGYLWPNATTRSNPDGLNLDLLVAPSNQCGEARLQEQFWRINIDPSERYVLSVKTSTKNRLHCSETGFKNLVITGDWTHNAVLNAGCVEATVTSGMQAARSICGLPETIVGDSYTKY